VVPSKTECPAFSKESRMNFASATKVRRKSGKRRRCGTLPRYDPNLVSAVTCLSTSPTKPKRHRHLGSSLLFFTFFSLSNRKVFPTNCICTVSLLMELLNSRRPWMPFHRPRLGDTIRAGRPLPISPRRYLNNLGGRENIKFDHLDKTKDLATGRPQLGAPAAATL
jgi:hypothetical protein